MKTGVRVLCLPEVAAGFALAGVSVDTVTPESNSEATLTRLLGQGDIGVLLVEDRIYRALGDDTRRQVDRSATPVVVPFPSPSWEAAPPAEQYVVELLRRAIGYRVRLG